MGKAIKSDNIRTENTDRCIRKAIDMQQQFRLPSNFSYKVMEKINEKILVEEKRHEKQIFIAIIATSVSMIIACISLIIVRKGITLADITDRITNIPTLSDILFYLPMFITLPLLFLFNYWLRRKYRHLLKN